MDTGIQKYLAFHGDLWKEFSFCAFAPLCRGRHLRNNIKKSPANGKT